MNWRANLKFIHSPQVLIASLEDNESSILNLVYSYSLKNLNRYGIQKGKRFGKTPGKPRFEILEIQRSQVIYKDLSTGKVFNKDIDELLNQWESQDIYEVSEMDEIMSTINKYLAPLLGATLTAALISWLMGKTR